MKNPRIQYIISVFIIILFCSFLSLAAADQSAGNGSKRPIVVLDPGHGGHDQGGRGPSGTLEKEVSLTLVRSIAQSLGDAYQIILTRNDDYHVESYRRTAKANYHKADLFISLHNGGSPLRMASGINIFYYQPPAGFQLTSDTNGSAVFQTESENIPWRAIQLRYVTDSRHLAESLQQSLRSMPGNPACQIQGGPMVVLQGASMPAVLIELGYLTNPMEEKELLDHQSLSTYAKKIAAGIETFLANQVALKEKP